MYTRPILADFSHLDALLTELDGYRPLPQDVTRKLTEKLRLDWNYHSNALEGNTLTYGETKALLLADRYVGNKEGRHYREISAHNDVLKTLDELINIDKDRALTEGLIRDLHKQMLGEPYYSYAETMDGQPTQKRIVPGEYKQQPNSVLRSTGEMFYYAEPFEVSAKMQELLEAYRQINTDPEIHPVALAAWFHYEFIRIHPFDDGNGRLARILMNLILQRRGLVPAIVRVEEKTPYIDALAVADGTDDLTEFTLFIAKQVERIVDLEVRAARGEDISEPGDWEKELEIIGKRVLTMQDVSFSLAGSEYVREWFKKFIQVLEELEKPFMRLFLGTQIKYSAIQNDHKYAIEPLSFNELKQQLPNYHPQKAKEYQFRFEFNHYVLDEKKSLIFTHHISLYFGEYTILLVGPDYRQEFGYNQELNMLNLEKFKNHEGKILTRAFKELTGINV